MGQVTLDWGFTSPLRLHHSGAEGKRVRRWVGSPPRASAAQALAIMVSFHLEQLPPLLSFGDLKSLLFIRPKNIGLVRLYQKQNRTI